MAGSFTLPTVLANLTAGNQPLALIDGDFNALSAPLLSLNTFSNGYLDTGAANAYVITVASPQTISQAQFLAVQFFTTNANTGASTLQINALAAKNIKNLNGTALSAGQIPANSIVQVMYDGTQYLLLSSAAKPITLATPQATTSGTSIDFTGIPSGTKRITIMFVGVSTSGTDNWLVQLGDSGGIETSGYLGIGGSVNGSTPATGNFTTGFGIQVGAAASVIHGTLTLTLENSATFTWTAEGSFGASNAATSYTTAGSKSTSAELDRVRITTTAGTDTFDAGAINISFE